MKYFFYPERRFVTFAPIMIEKLKTSRIVLIVIVAIGLLYITDSWFMSMGILIILIVVDKLLADYSKKKQDKKEQEDGN